MNRTYKTGAMILSLSMAISSSYAVNLKARNLTGKSALRGTFFSSGKKMGTSFDGRGTRIVELNHSYGTASFRETKTGHLEYQEFHSAPLIDPDLYTQNAIGPFPVTQVSLPKAKDWFVSPASVLDQMSASLRKKSTTKNGFAVRKDKQGLVLELTEIAQDQKVLRTNATGDRELTSLQDINILSSQHLLIDSRPIYSDVRQTGPDRFVLAVVVEKDGDEALEGSLYQIRHESGSQSFNLSPYRIPGSTRLIPRKTFGLDAPKPRPTPKSGIIL